MDNAPSMLVREFWLENKTVIIPKPLDLILVDILLLLKLNTVMQGYLWYQKAIFSKVSRIGKKNAGLCVLLFYLLGNTIVIRE